MQLRRSFNKLNVKPMCFRFQDIAARVGFKPEFSINEVDLLAELSAVIVRSIGRGSLEEIIFRMDILHRLHRFGMYLLNNPLAIERAVDKYYALSLLEENGFQVPKTLVAESASIALSAFKEL